MEVEINIQVSKNVPHSPIAPEIWHQWLRTWLKHLHLPPAPGYELSLRLTDNQEIQQFNAQYRHKDTPTDVLAFAALEAETPLLPECEDPLYLGDVIISVETAHQQAQQQGHSETVELAWLMAHGLLHLLGWDHPCESSLEAMLAQQEFLLHQVGLTLGEANPDNGDFSGEMMSSSQR